MADLTNSQGVAAIPGKQGPIRVECGLEVSFLPSTMAVTHLKKGQKGTVVELATKKDVILRKLMSMGILPGVDVEVRQTFPVYILQTGYTQVAVDGEIAKAILVQP